MNPEGRYGGHGSRRMRLERSDRADMYATDREEDDSFTGLTNPGGGGGGGAGDYGSMRRNNRQQQQQQQQQAQQQQDARNLNAI